MFDPHDSRTVGYHLFLMPRGDTFIGFQNLINELAHWYDGPKFDPHVTLLARIPASDQVGLISAAGALAARMQPFVVELEKVEAQDAYFQALYWKAGNNAYLQAYHDVAAAMFGLKAANPYTPHLSLFYGNVSMEVKAEMMKLIPPVGGRFTASTLHLYRTEGRVENWVQVWEGQIG